MKTRVTACIRIYRKDYAIRAIRRAVTNSILCHNLLFPVLNTTKNSGTCLWVYFFFCILIEYPCMYVQLFLLSSLRKAKLDLQRTKPVSSTVNKAKNLLHDAHGKSESLSSINRTDSGRFSTRVNRGLSMVGVCLSNITKFSMQHINIYYECM